MNADAARERLAAALIFECGLTASAAEARAAVDKLLPVVREIAAEEVAPLLELRGVLADLTEAVGRGDEHGLPEAYRAACRVLRHS